MPRKAGGNGRLGFLLLFVLVVGIAKDFVQTDRQAYII